MSIIPKTESEMELFQGAVTGPIAEFEKKVELFGLLPETEVSGEGLLSAAARDIRGKFLEARCGLLLLLLLQMTFFLLL